MSLYSLGADAAIRKKAAVTVGGTQVNVHAMTAKSAADAERDGLATLALFIPAETIAIYVTIAGVLLKTIGNQSAAAWTWWTICIVLSGAFTWVAFAVTWRKNNNGAYPAWQAAPRFRIFAAAFAFAFWGVATSSDITKAMFCASNSDPNCAQNANALAGAAIIVVSIVLAMLDRLIDYDNPIVTKAKLANPGNAGNAGNAGGGGNAG